ncbi:MAG: cation:proton antiporter [Chthoniobacterales bacterium]
MNELAILLIIASVGFALSMLLRIPSVPLLIAGGFAAARLGFEIKSSDAITMLEIGVAFLVFTAGLELNPKRFKHQTRQVFWVAVLQFIICGFAAFSVARALGFETLAATYMGFAVSASSTLVVVGHLRSQQQMFQPFGRLVTGVLLLQDFAVIFVLVILSAISKGENQIGISLGGFIVAALIALFAHYRLIPRLVKKLRTDDEALLLTGVSVFFIFLAGASWLNLPIVAGAFLAGFSLAAFPANGLLRGTLGSLSGFFQAVFFTALGMILVAPNTEILLDTVALSLLVLVLTPILVAAIFEFTGQSARTGISSGLHLAQVSELGIVLAGSGLVTGILTLNQFSVLALVAGITMSLTPFIATDKMAWRLMHWHPGKRNLNAMSKFREHILVLGFGNSGMWVVKPLQQAGHRILVVDDDGAVIEELALMGVPCLRGDASDSGVLKFVGATKAKMILVSIPRLSDILKIIQMAPNIPVIARVFEEAEAEAIRQAGGIPILNSDAACETFLEWFENFTPKEHTATS